MSAYMQFGHHTLWLPIDDCQLVCSLTGCWRVLVYKSGDNYRHTAYASPDHDAASVVHASILAAMDAHRRHDSVALAHAQRRMRALLKTRG